MTRINIIDPSLLTDQALFAEYREIKMVPRALARSLKTQSIGTILGKIPKQFTLNSGHVLFFYTRLKYLDKRYYQLVEELKKRNYRDNQDWEPFSNYTENLPDIFFGDYLPNDNAYAIIKERLIQKIMMKPSWYRYYGQPITNDDEIFNKVIFNEVA